ncbi:hypothetical protein BGZ95_004855 [Linnemannia exigua]|uniref:Uncharacterized protein n=1 Tax=Linnemannia exigua TaxID=604196 RepID=A0AAD4D2K3_9FUNG|nr:hypothetical protein BGZ95_004855 [Linnemannia exigua]
MSVAFDFDVQDHEVLLNKVPLKFESEQPEEPITVTVTVEAGVVVTASTEFVTAEDGSIVRRVTLQESIVEVNGHEITQTDAAQQVIEIMPDGSLGSFTPLLAGTSGCQGAQLDDVMKSIDDWFRSLNWPAFMVAGLVALSMFVVSATSLRALILKRRQARYAKVQQHESVAEFEQVAVIDDKKVLEDEKKAEF